MVRSETLKNGVQALAIFVAGTWAVFEFGINEDRLSFKLNPVVSSSLGPVVAGRDALPPLRPLSISIKLENVGEHPGQIALAALSVTGNVHAYDQTWPTPVFNLGSGPSIVYAEIDWTAERYPLSYSFFAPSAYLQPRETISDGPVILVTNPQDYDSLSYFLIVWALESCTGFLSGTCVSVALEIHGPPATAEDDGQPIGCAEGEWLTSDYCGTFYIETSTTGPQPITAENLRTTYKMQSYTYEGLVVIPRTAPEQ